MAGRNCYGCVYSVCEPEVWLHAMWAGEPVVPRCANHPRWPGQLREVPGVPCRNYWPRPVPPRGSEVRLIPFGDGLYAYVDAADYEELSRHTWNRDNGYAVRSEKGKRIYMHRCIVEAPPGMVVDHIDGSRANNCRFNLRVCTRAQNQLNLPRRRGSRSGFKGVFWDKVRRKWYVLCRGGGEEHWGGVFDDTVEAAHVYDRMAIGYLGVHTRLNFPEEWPPKRRAEFHAQWQAALKNEGKKAGRKEGKKATPGEKASAKRSTGQAQPRATGDKRPGTNAGGSEGKKVRTASTAGGGTELGTEDREQGTTQEEEGRKAKGKKAGRIRKARSRAAGRGRRPRTGK